MHFKNVCIVNCPSDLTGFVKTELVEDQGEDYLLTYAIGSEGMRISTRSAVDKSALELAKAIDPVKAGGHVLAAGAFIPYSDFKTHWLTKELFSL